MKRRDVLRMAPLAAAGAAAGGSMRDLLWPGPVRGPLPAGSGVTTAEVRPHNGSPALFLDGRPVFAAINWVSGAGARTDGISRDRRGRAPRPGSTSTPSTSARGSSGSDPGPGRQRAITISRPSRRGSGASSRPIRRPSSISASISRPATATGGRRPIPASARSSRTDAGTACRSPRAVWRDEAKAFLRAYIAHFRRIGLFDRVIAYQVGAGHTGEWVKGESSMYAPCGDYSEPMRVYFRDWLKARYRGDDRPSPGGLGHDPAVTFETAAVPAAERQLEARLYTFRDPRPSGTSSTISRPWPSSAPTRSSISAGRSRRRRTGSAWPAPSTAISSTSPGTAVSSRSARTPITRPTSGRAISA